MGVIKGVLKEELANSIRLKKAYEKALKADPGGALIKKRIGAQEYYYLAFRDGKKVKFVYKGKGLSREDISLFEKAKQQRVKRKDLIKKLKNQIKFLERALHGKEDV